MQVFNLYNDDFIINDDFEKYNKYRILFTNIAKEATSDFLDMYKQEIYNMDLLINKIPPYTRELITNTISSEVIRVLVQEGVMTINTELFLAKYYYKHFDFDKYFDPILEKYTQITDAKESLNSYREMQKASRSRWQGGGFGVKGALKGAMTAGALNLGTDILRSFSDSNTSRQDRNKINSMKEQVYNNPNIISTLKLGIYNCIFGQFYALIDELVENDIMEPIFLQEKEARIMLENTLKYDRSSPEKMLKNIIKSLRMNPYDFDTYKLLIASNNDCNDLIELAYYFGFDRELETVLKEKYKEQINSIENLPETNCDEVFRKIMEYSELEKTSHIFLSDRIMPLSQKLSYDVKSGKEMAEYYWVLTEIYPNTPSDIQDIFVDKMNEYRSNKNLKTNEFAESYKCIDSKGNLSSICTILKVINKSDVFAFSQDEKIFAYVNDKSGIPTFNTNTFEIETVLNAFCNPNSIFFDENSDNIVEIYGDTITKRNIKSGEIIVQKGSVFNRVFSVTYSKNKLYIGGSNTEVDNSYGIEVVNIDKMSSLNTLKTNFLPGDLSISFDGRYISSIFMTDFHILDTYYGREVKSLINLDENEEITIINFSPNSSLIAYANTNGIITVWDYSKNKSICYLNCKDKPITSLVFYPNDRFLAVACSDNSILIWNLRNQKLEVTLLGYESIGLNPKLAFSPNGRLLISSDSSKNNEDDDAKDNNKRLVIWSIKDDLLRTNDIQSNTEYITDTNQVNNEVAASIVDEKYHNKSASAPKVSTKNKRKLSSDFAPIIVMYSILLLLAYNLIGNKIIKYVIIFILIAACIQAIINSIKKFREENKKNNC
jgi:WD40 repeat protein